MYLHIGAACPPFPLPHLQFLSITHERMWL